MSDNKRSGFTLVEIMVTVAITGILAAIATPMYMKYTLRARTVEAAANLGAIKTSEFAHMTNFDTYLTVQIEPPLPITGAKKSWSNMPAVINAAQTGVGTFKNMDYSPVGQVYFHYSCRAVTDAMRCEAVSDLDHDGQPQAWIYAHRGDPSSMIPNGLITGGLPVHTVGSVYNMSKGRY